ncbi:MAG: LexA family protein [Rhodothermia bacterium]
MNRRQLTRKQLDFYQYLRSYIEVSGGLWPTYREVVDQFRYRSPNSVTQNLQALLKKGFLKRDQNGYQLTDRSLSRNGKASIPIVGVISAGHLQEAVESNLGSITLETLFPNLDRIFAIRVAGNSMIGADINDGDYVLLIDDDIPDGGIGAVLYDGETSLKRIFQTDRGLRLEPANDEYPDIRIEPGVFEEVRLLGRYVGHMNTTGVYKAAS